MSAELEAAIASDPYDVDTYLVYADWLQRHGDPRSELIALQIAAERGPDRDQAAAAAAAHLASHAAALLGPLADHPGEPFLWRSGFIHHAHLDRGRLDEILDQLLGHPSGRFLTELAVVADARETADAVLEVLARRAPASLRVLDLFVRDELGDLSAALHALPRLHDLAVTAQDFDPGALDLPVLARGRLIGTRLSARCVRAIAAAAWPRLEQLELRIGGGEASIDDLRPLLRRTDLPALTRLALHGLQFGGEVCRELPRAALAAQLVELDLSEGWLGDTDAQALVDQLRCFPRLRELRLPEDRPAAALPADAHVRIIGVPGTRWDHLDRELSTTRTTQAVLEGYIDAGGWEDGADELFACMLSPWLLPSSACLAVLPGRADDARAILAAPPTRDPGLGDSASPRAFFRLCERRTLRFARSQGLLGRAYDQLPVLDAGGAPAWYVELHNGDLNRCYAGFAAIYRTLVALAPLVADAHVLVWHGQFAIVDELRIRGGAVWWERRDEDEHRWHDFLPEYLIRRARQERDDDVADRMRRLASLHYLESADYLLERSHADQADRELAPARDAYPGSRELLELEARLARLRDDDAAAIIKLRQARAATPLLVRP